MNYLDVTLDLKTENFRPHRKPDNTPTFIHAYSNHPPPPSAILKQIPKSVGQRVSSRSSSKDEFDKTAPLNNVAFKESAPFVEIDNQERKKNSKRNRHRNVIWFNPRYSKNVETSFGKRFLKLLDDHFPKSHKLHKIFNRENVKMSYGCVDNIAQIIKKHNKKVLTPESTSPQAACNYRDKPVCPLDGACLTKSIVYQTEVKTGDGQTKQYIGMTERPFKTRYTMHKQSIRNSKYQHSTALSKYIWEYKSKGKSCEIKWSIMKRAIRYQSGTNHCSLCTQAKFCIINGNKETLLNQRSELISKCTHENKFYACNYKP